MCTRLRLCAPPPLCGILFYSESTVTKLLLVLHRFRALPYSSTRPSLALTAMHSHLPVRAYWSNSITDSSKPIAMDATITGNKFICIAPEPEEAETKGHSPWHGATLFSLLVLRVHPLGFASFRSQLPTQSRF